MGTGRREPLRVVVVEDSEITSAGLVRLIEEDKELRVAGVAHSGRKALEMIAELRPDLITLDLSLPDLDGFAVTRQVMADYPTPILVFTTELKPQWRRDAYDALALGALDVMEKPRQAAFSDPGWRQRFRQQIKLLAGTAVIPHVIAALEKPKAPPERLAPSGPRPVESTGSPRQLMVVVGSAGSPRAVRALLAEMSRAFPLPVPLVIALHLGEQMGPTFSIFLHDLFKIPVATLGDGDELRSGSVYLVPGNRHVELLTPTRVRVFSDLPDAPYVPSLDYFLWSVARVCGTGAAAAILSGMGSDGADGLLALHRTGAFTLAQDEESSVIYGMPAVAQRVGAVDEILPPPKIGARLLQWLLPPGGASTR